MALNISVYSNTNTSSRTITVDFVQDYLVGEYDTAGNVASECFFKIITSAKDTDNLAYPVKIIRKMSDPYLALTNCQSHIHSYSTAPYSNIKSMIIDYVYDYVRGHEKGEGPSKCEYKAPMKFS